MPSTVESPRKVEVRCACGFRARARAELAGRKVKCKECGARVVVGGSDERVVHGSDERVVHAAAIPAKPARAPRLVASDKNLILGVVMVLWAVGSVFAGLARAKGLHGIGVYAATLLPPLVLLAAGIKTCIHGARKVHVPDEDVLYAPGTLAFGVVLIATYLWLLLQEMQARPGTTETANVVTHAICVLGSWLTMQGLIGMRAAAETAKADA